MLKHPVNRPVDIEQIIAQGNTYREQNQPEQALRCYAEVFTQNHNHAGAWNNYGNVLREMGYPERALPFLQHCLAIDPNHTTARFNLSVALLLMGDYERGWPAYESRWQFEHLAGALPNFTQPRWTGQDIKDKTILLIGEQGLGDTIQFCRYCLAVADKGAKVVVAVPGQMVSMFTPNNIVTQVVAFGDSLPAFDFWAPMMSLPGIFNQRINNLYAPLHYIHSDGALTAAWKEKLGKKLRLRIGFSWSGRRDTWINKHKSVPFDKICDLIQRAPQHQWINLQIDATAEESAALEKLGVDLYPGSITCMADTSALIENLDVVVSVDTAVSHLAAAMARPTWIMLNHFATDWRWLLNRDDSPWYPTARLFRQPTIGDWSSVIDRVSKHLDLFKI